MMLLRATIAAAIAALWLIPGHAQTPVNEACLTPAAIDDADVAAHATELAAASLCLSVRTVEENGIAWTFVIVANREVEGPLWYVPHDEEDEGFSGGVYAVLRYGGTMVAVENRERRLVAGVDPNRIFAVDPAAAAVCGSVPAPLYVGAIMDHRSPDYPVIGLHSNWDGYVEAGGLGTISVRRPDDKMIPFPSTLGTGRMADEDTIVMLVGAASPAGDPAADAAVAWFNSRGAHVIYRHVTEANNQCTLADYLTLKRIAPYVNLEVEHGDFTTQPELIDRVMSFISSSAYFSLN